MLVLCDVSRTSYYAAIDLEWAARGPQRVRGHARTSSDSPEGTPRCSAGASPEQSAVSTAHSHLSQRSPARRHPQPAVIRSTYSDHDVLRAAAAGGDRWWLGAERHAAFFSAAPHSLCETRSGGAHPRPGIVACVHTCVCASR
eukprot:180115-Chlamydomonas_euryale.AAC.4